MERAQIVGEMEQLLLPQFRDAATDVSSIYPRYKFSVFSSAIGGATDYQGHNLGLECTFPDAADHEADCVAALIGVKHLTSRPQFWEAAVEWGGGAHPEVRGELLENPLPATQEALQELSRLIPQLLVVFRSALLAWSTRGAAPNYVSKPTAGDGLQSFRLLPAGSGLTRR